MYCMDYKLCKLLLNWNKRKIILNWKMRKKYTYSSILNDFIIFTDVDSNYVFGFFHFFSEIKNPILILNV